MENKIGERIRYFRLSKGLSQEKLALIAGLNPAFLGHLSKCNSLIKRIVCCKKLYLVYK